MNMNENLRLLRQKKEIYGSEFNEHLLEQYKLYVNMTDRISARRMLANSFFLAIHVVLIAIFVVLLEKKAPPLIFTGIISFGIIISIIWWFIIDSYRQLNKAKFDVISTLEQVLPAEPYRAEWSALGSDKDRHKLGLGKNSKAALESSKDRKLYWPLTYIEHFVPVCFCLMYISLISYIYL